MSTKAGKRKKAASSPGTQSADLRRDVQEAIDRVWPAGIVELSFDSDESYFCEIHPKLSRAFHRLRNARLVQEREADGGPIWWDQSDPQEDPPDEIEHSRSYHLFFVSPEGKAFTFQTEAEGFEEPELMTEEFEEGGSGADLLHAWSAAPAEPAGWWRCRCSRPLRSSNSGRWLRLTMAVRPRRRLSPMEKPPTLSRSTRKNTSRNRRALRRSALRQRQKWQTDSEMVRKRGGSSLANKRGATRRLSDPIERQIELALCPGEFIYDRACFSFVSRLDGVAAEIRSLTRSDPARATTLCEAFLAGCHQKVEELDDSSGGFGQFVQDLICLWIKARQGSGAERRQNGVHVAGLDGR